MKYRVYFSGYGTVEADSENDAIENFDPITDFEEIETMGAEEYVYGA